MLTRDVPAPGITHTSRSAHHPIPDATAMTVTGTAANNPRTITTNPVSIVRVTPNRSTIRGMLTATRSDPAPYAPSVTASAASPSPNTLLT